MIKELHPTDPLKWQDSFKHEIVQWVKEFSDPDDIPWSPKRYNSLFTFFIVTLKQINQYSNQQTLMVYVLYARHTGKLGSRASPFLVKEFFKTKYKLWIFSLEKSIHKNLTYDLNWWHSQISHHSYLNPISYIGLEVLIFKSRIRITDANVVSLVSRTFFFPVIPLWVFWFNLFPFLFLMPELSSWPPSNLQPSGSYASFKAQFKWSSCQEAPSSLTPIEC